MQHWQVDFIMPLSLDWAFNYALIAVDTTTGLLFGNPAREATQWTVVG